MRKDLKAFVRVDASGRVVPGSMVLRKRMPGNPSFNKNGSWIEVQTYTCCIPAGDPGGPGAPQTITGLVPTDTPDTFFVQFTVNGVSTEEVNTGATTIAGLASYLTTNYSAMGTFIVDGTSLIFTPSTPGVTLNVSPTTQTQVVALPTLTGPLPNYHIELTNGDITTGDIDTGTITDATLIIYLNTNYGTNGSFAVVGTDVYYTPVSGSLNTVLAITAGA